MKKLKVMLTLITVLAILGGIFAFKAKNSFGSIVFFTFTTAHTTSCQVLGVNFTTTVNNPGGLTQVYYTTGTQVSTCLPTAVFLKPKE
jgi:hypothetical protein